MTLSQDFKLLLQQKLNLPFPRLNYVSYPFFPTKSIYFETPKVACTAIKMLLLWNKDPNNQKILPPQIHNQAQRQLPRLKDLEESQVEEVLFGNFYRFAFVRNPMTRMLSSYLDKIVYNEYERNRLLPNLGIKENKVISFKEFLLLISEVPNEKRDIHFMSQSEILMINKINYNFIGRFENFKNDFNFVQSKILKVKNFSKLEKQSKHHSTNAVSFLNEYYTPETEQLCKKIYKDDFDNFNF